ncbi:hypothetical protein AB4084_40045, partial [Lysobacter sp. 2RAB21]
VLPPVGEALNPVPGVFASMRGFVVPALSFELDSAGAGLILLALALTAAAWIAGPARRLRSGLTWSAAGVLLLGLWLADIETSV